MLLIIDMVVCSCQRAIISKKPLQEKTPTFHFKVIFLAGALRELPVGDETVDESLCSADQRVEWEECAVRCDEIAEDIADCTGKQADGRTVQHAD